MKNRRSYWCLLALVGCIQVEAAAVLILKSQSSAEAAASYGQAVDGFRQAYGGESRIVEGKRDFQRAIATERPWLILAAGRQAVEIARDSSKNVPVLFMMVPNPAGLGLTGANIGGVSLDIPSETQLRYYKELLPNLKALGVIFNPANNLTAIREATAAAQRLGIKLVAVPAESSDDVTDAFALIGRASLIDALWLLPDPAFASLRWEEFLREIKGRELPFVAAAESLVKAGALAGPVSDERDIGRQCGELANELAQGKIKFADIGTRAPRTTTFLINGATARDIHLPIPRNVEQAARLLY